MKRLYIAAVMMTMLVSQAAVADCTKSSCSWNYGAGTGALSYEFFNLSGYACNVTYYGGNANPYAPLNSPAAAMGWSGDPLNSDQPNDGFGFFNYDLKPDSKYQNRLIYFTSPDPIQAPVTITGTSGGTWVTGTYPQNGGTSGLSFGDSISAIEYSSELRYSVSPAAIGDSWIVQCATNTTVQGQPTLMANMGAAGASFMSSPWWESLNPTCFFGGNEPYSNWQINPAAPGSFGPFNNCTDNWNSPYYDSYGSNPLGMGFVDGSTGSTLNFNASWPTTNGGLWGAGSSSNTVAAYSLVPAMFPVNYANYVTASVPSWQDPAISGYGVQATPIYGGHFTLAIGDPFIVSSFAAKILWFLSSNAGWSLSDSTFTPSSSAVSGGDIGFELALNAPGNTVFGTGIGQNYVNWLVNSASVAGYVANNLNTSASKPINTESVWGKIFTSFFNAGMTAMKQASSVWGKPLLKDAAGITSPTGDFSQRFAVNETTGALQPVVDNAIGNAFTSQTNLPAPSAQQAPLAVNNSFSSSNLLGMLLTNYQVQAEVTGAIGLSGAPNPLWSNADIYINSLCAASSLAVTSNLFSSNVQCNNASGTLVAQSALSPVPDYVNAYSLNSAVNGATSQLNIWDALLTGADISTSSSGQLVLSNPVTSSFQPPTLINDSSTNAIQTSFDIQTGVYTLQSYANIQFPGTLTVGTYNDPFVESPECNPYQIQADGYVYTSLSGIVSVTSVQNGCPGNWTGGLTLTIPPTLSLATCASGSGVNLTSWTEWSSSIGGSTATLACSQPLTWTISTPASNPDCLQSGTFSVDSATGILSMSSYQSGCQNPVTTTLATPLSLDLAACQWGSGVAILTTDTSGSPVLECQDWSPTTTIATDSQPALDYNLCVADQNATGGVVAMEINGSPSLACVCMPNYLSGIGNTATTGLSTGYYAITNSGSTIGQGGTAGSACTLGDG